MSIKKEEITINGTVIYCDGCEARGPVTAYDDPLEVMWEAEQLGWAVDDEDRDFCPKCNGKSK